MPWTKTGVEVAACVVAGCGRPGNMPRRLCWGCYSEPAVRVLYPPRAKCGRRGSGANVRASKGVASEGCPYPVGSAAQLQVLALRAKAGVDLFHPGDSREVETREPRSGGRKHKGASGDRVYKNHFYEAFPLSDRPGRLRFTDPFFTGR